MNIEPGRGEVTDVPLAAEATGAAAVARACCGAPPALTCTEKACPLTFTVYVALPATGVAGVVDAVTGKEKPKDDEDDD